MTAAPAADVRPAPSWGRRTATAVAVTATLAAVAQTLLLSVGIGGWLPGWQPLPWLLIAVPAWLFARPAWRTPPAVERAVDLLRRIPAWGYALAVLAMAAAVWAALQDSEPWIGHEEAVYADKARSWHDGTPAAGWGTYRPVGLPALGRLALAVHNDVGALRAVALLLTLFTLTATYVTAARLTTPRRAVVTTLLLLGGLGFLRRVPEFLNDIGATGLLLLVVLLLVRAQEKPGSRALPAAAVIAVAAFYLRYGVVGNLAAIVLGALLAYGPRAWLAHRWRLACAAGILAAGLLPHFLYAVRETGSPLGLVFSATSQANRAYTGDGFVYYLSVFPYRLAGDLGAVVMAAGLYGAAAALLRRRRARRGTAAARPDDARRVFLGAAAVLTFVILGMVTDGEPRFVYLPVALLTMLGVQTAAECAGRRAATVLAATAALAAVTVPATAQYVAHAAMPGPTGQAASTVPVARGLARDGSCLLVTGYEPEAGWYSGCDAVTYAQYRRMTPPEDTRVTFVLFEHGRLQPDAEGLERLVAGRPVTVTTFPTDGSLGTATTVTLR
ncbi:glycosyltransferase family 39 protein [Streptomyces sp. NPDC049881]|uniref:glycosyltransferase family 39 protein n=1 Tax=Streptomyces sp. NPDC049881 TaxID=3155778 RepID=UPI00343DE1ED